MEEAKSVLTQAMRSRPEDAKLHQETVNVFLYGEMYEEAKQVFRTYRDRTGKVLHGDHSLEEVERLANDALTKDKPSGGSNNLVFKQMSCREALAQRGHLINWNSLPLISEIRIYPDRLVLRKWWVDRAYPWSEITSATLTRHPVRADAANFLEKTLRLEMKGKVILKKDIGVYQGRDVLLRELKKHCMVKETQRKARKFPLWAWIALFILTFFGSAWLQAWLGTK